MTTVSGPPCRRVTVASVHRGMMTFMAAHEPTEWLATWPTFSTSWIRPAGSRRRTDSSHCGRTTTLSVAATTEMVTGLVLSRPATTTRTAATHSAPTMMIRSRARSPAASRLPRDAPSALKREYRIIGLTAAVSRSIHPDRLPRGSQGLQGFEIEAAGAIKLGRFHSGDGLAVPRLAGDRIHDIGARGVGRTPEET